MTQKEIDEIRASLDSTAPYYVAALLAERDRLTEELAELRPEYESGLSREASTFAELKERRQEVLELIAERDRLTQEVRELDMALAAWKEWGFKQSKAEAEAARLRWMWDVLNDIAVTHWAGMATDDAGDSLAELIKSIEESTPSGPAEEGR